MQMTTSGYISAFQGVRALWNWLRKKEPETETCSAREEAIEQAELERELALMHAETQRSVEQVRTQSRAERLAPVLAMYEVVQANKRQRLSQASDDLSATDASVVG
ncbi:MAG: hypothetical protein ACPHJD_06475 [Poseidonia sp.]|jgi:hypothetical protein